LGAKVSKKTNQPSAKLPIFGLVGMEEFFCSLSLSLFIFAYYPTKHWFYFAFNAAIKNILP
jgi:hypothetical protein